MYVRVASFEGRDTSRIDELVELIREQAREGPGIPGAKEIMTFIDRATGRSLGLTFFETEEALRTAAPAFEQMGSRIPAELRGRRVSIDVYEVALRERLD
jgi:hypothetical protein